LPPAVGPLAAVVGVAPVVDSQVLEHALDGFETRRRVSFAMGAHYIRRKYVRARRDVHRQVVSATRHMRLDRSNVFGHGGCGAATEHAAQIPAALQQFAHKAVLQALKHPGDLNCALGELLSEPKPQVWFEAAALPRKLQGVRLDRKSKMLYDDDFVFINGESFSASGRDAQLIRKLAQARMLKSSDVERLGAGARDLVSQWCEAGWLYVVH
jgi:hypothetical protein